MRKTLPILCLGLCLLGAMLPRQRKHANDSNGWPVRSVIPRTWRKHACPSGKHALLWVRSHAPEFLDQMKDVQPNGDIHFRFWQRGGGYDRNLRSLHDVHEKINYIHANPVRRGLVERVSDWPWSSWRAWQTGQDVPIGIDRERFGALSWSGPCMQWVPCPRSRGHVEARTIRRIHDCNPNMLIYG